MKASIAKHRVFSPGERKWKFRVIEMPRNIYVVLYILVLIAVVVSVDLLFFENRFWERLIVNIGIVLVFGAFYLRFLNNP